MSAGLLTGLLYDDRGNRLTPSHTNKRGIRYRYYVSQAVLQNKGHAPITIRRIAAHDIEQAVVAAVRSWRPMRTETSDRDLIARYVRSVIIENSRLRIDVCELNEAAKQSQAENDLDVDPSEPASSDNGSSDHRTIVLTVSWVAKRTRCDKHLQQNRSVGLSDEDRLRLLTAIGKARRWMRDVELDLRTFEDIAAEENCVERHIRFLAPLAYLSPRIVQAIDDCSGPSDWTVSMLARALPHDWRSQEAKLGLRS